MEPTKLFGVIGHPLGHTMSPALHNWAFARLGLPYVYMRWPVAPEGLPDFLTAVRALPISGVSVTIPHKVAITNGLDRLGPRVRAVGAVNTLFWDEDKLTGVNSDVVGFQRPLRESGRRFDSALVLGAGGASRAILAGLAELGVARVWVTNRSYKKAAELAMRFGVTAVEWDARRECGAALLVNATPLGMAGDNVDLTPWPAEWFEPGQVAYDIVYNPLRTRFLREAQAAGLETVDGLAMFLGQAVEQFRLWTGQEFPLVEARELLLAELAR